VTAYIQGWYRELGSRLAAAETPLAGFPPDAVSLMTELWRLASTDQAKARDSEAADDTATRMLAAERDSLEAEAKALQTLNQELQRHRSTAEKSLAEARALLARREAALDEERARGASLDQALAEARLELEVALERHRLAPAREPQRQRKVASRKPKLRRASRSVPKTSAAVTKRRPRKRATSKRAKASSRTRKKTRNRKGK
jgi:chromosome segregation ATPase